MIKQHEIEYIMVILDHSRPKKTKNAPYKPNVLRNLYFLSVRAITVGFEQGFTKLV